MLNTLAQKPHLPLEIQAKTHLPTYIDDSIFYLTLLHSPVTTFSGLPGTLTQPYFPHLSRSFFSLSLSFSLPLSSLNLFCTHLVGRHMQVGTDTFAHTYFSHVSFRISMGTSARLYPILRINKSWQNLTQVFG